jgi:hypothetical protein
LLGVCLLVVIGVFAWFTPALSVRTVKIDGLVAVPEQQVRNQLEIPSGRSILRIDTTSMAKRVASIPEVRTVRVQRLFPSTVKVTVAERAPILFFDSPQGAEHSGGRGCRTVDFGYFAEPARRTHGSVGRDERCRAKGGGGSAAADQGRNGLRRFESESRHGKVIDTHCAQGFFGGLASSRRGAGGQPSTIRRVARRDERDHTRFCHSFRRACARIVAAANSVPHQSDT